MTRSLPEGDCREGDRRPPLGEGKRSPWGPQCACGFMGVASRSKPRRQRTGRRSLDLRGGASVCRLTDPCLTDWWWRFFAQDPQGATPIQKTGVEKTVWSRDVSLRQSSLTSRSSSAVFFSFPRDLLKFSLFSNHHRYYICFAGAVVTHTGP